MDTKAKKFQQDIKCGGCQETIPRGQFAWIVRNQFREGPPFEWKPACYACYQARRITFKK